MIEVIERFSDEGSVWVNYREFCFAYHSGEWRAAKMLGNARYLYFIL